MTFRHEVIGEQPATGGGLLQLALLLRDARGTRPASLALRDPRLDVFRRVESDARAQDRDGPPAKSPMGWIPYACIKDIRTPSNSGRHPNLTGAGARAILVDI